jgi:hypothetical protein
MNGIEDHSSHRFGVGNQDEVRSAVEFGDGGLGTRRRKRIIMGSDFPHVEGLADPASYIKDLENFDYTPDECRTVMRDNGLELSIRQPV